MPNTAVHRVESCCMPPKKSSWRFENAKLPEHPSPKSDIIESQKINNYNMGLMSDDTEVKPVDQMHFYHSMDTFSHIKHSQTEDAPLDFSLKKGEYHHNSDDKSESARHFVKQLENYEQHNGGGNMVNHPTMQMFHPAILFNGNHSPSSLRNNSPGSHASSSCKDSDSIDMDCSQESVKSPRNLVAPGTSGISEINRENSPDLRNVSKEDSPVGGQSSILEEMLKGQQPANFGITSRPQTFGNGYGAGLGVYENQIITSPSPPMAMGTPIVHPANMLPLAMAPYFPYGYVEPSNPFMSGYMYKPPESNTVDVAAVRKPKRKIDPFNDSLKSCSVEELRKKLDSLSRGNSLVINSDYAVNLKPRENGKRYPNSTVEPITNESSCSNVTKKENSETDNFIASQNQMNAKNNGVIIHNNENSTTASDAKQNDNNSQSQNIENHNQMNGANSTANISGADDTNDSLTSAMQESSPIGRRRNPSQDYRDDPNYRMKRAKNNLAARRSRESRRIKEEIIRQTAAVLEQQNKVIMRDLTTMRLSYDEAKMKYFSLLKDYENMKIQNSILTERLSQKRCGQCGSALPSVN